MPLIRLKDEYLEQEDGVRFLMADELGNTVACKVSHEALRAQAERVHFPGNDSAVFQAYRELIEELASDAFDVEGPFDNHGRAGVGFGKLLDNNHVLFLLDTVGVIGSILISLILTLLLLYACSII